MAGNRRDPSETLQLVETSNDDEALDGMLLGMGEPAAPQLQAVVGSSESRSAGQAALEFPPFGSRVSNFLDDDTPYKIRAATSAAEITSVKNYRRLDAELRDEFWSTRRELEKEAQREFLALLSTVELEAMQLADIPDEEKAFFSRKIPSRPPTPVALDDAALAAMALDLATLRPPMCHRIVEDEERMRRMIEDMCHTYWGVLLLEMKRSFLLKRRFS
jgi:hypothetical protein